MPAQKHVVWFKEVDKEDVNLVGGKGANLGEMVQADFPVPNGFIVTAPAYFYVLDQNNLRPKIKSILKGLDVSDPGKLNTASRKVKRLIENAEIPEDLADEIIKHYLHLDTKIPEPLVAIRSSATAEDLPDASFAGQQETFLNVKGTANVVDTIRHAWASLFEPRAIFYREQKGFNHFKVGIAVPVQKMIQSDVSGVTFTVDPVTEDKTTLIIEAVWGLGELIVQGAVNPDRYVVEKKTKKILKKFISEQEVQLVKKGDSNVKTPVPKTKQQKQKLTTRQVKNLAKLGKAIQQHYFFPQDIEWAIEKGKVYILQTRPITTLGAEEKADAAQKLGKAVSKHLKLTLKGDPASPGISGGKVKIIHSAREIGKVKKGDVLVTTMTTPDFVPAMRKVVAIVTDKGGQTSHAAIVSRELGITCVVGTSTATKKLKNGQLITVNGKTGEIFEGSLPPTKIKTITEALEPVRIETARKTATKVYVNLGEPDLAQEIAARDVDGVGLLRAEFMIAQIGTHPKKMLQNHKKQQFINKLSEAIEIFCRAFNPRPVVYRTTDFKTNEYRNLIGGKAFEPEEENPLIGFRGAFRYQSDEAVFDMELEAIKKVRNKLGFKNLWLMIPFVRSIEELIQVKRIIASHGLTRSPSFKLWLMVEIPSNVIMLEDYINVGIDGISIGTNDLTMLILGVDRDNEEVAALYNEQDPAVSWALERAVKIANKLGVTSSICGQAPSVYPDLTQRLVEFGITSVSISPDMIEKTREIIYQAELRKARKKH
jgi:pyruvate,water dikinase